MPSSLRLPPQAPQAQPVPYRETFRRSPAPQLLVDGDSAVVLDANDAATRILGYSCDELRRSGLRLLFSEADQERLPLLLSAIPSLADALQDRTVWTFRSHDGHESGWTVATQWMDAGRPVLLLAAAGEPTPTAQAAARQEDILKFAFAAFHDMKEPIQLVRGYLGLLEPKVRPKLDEEGAEFLSQTRAGADRLHRQIQDLLQYYRVSAQGPFLEPVDLARVVQDARAELDFAIRQANASIAVDPLPTVKADRRQMGALLQNLLSNAIKFHRASGPKVHVSARATPEGHEISVADDGIGIAAADRQRVFQPFQRVHSIDRYPGTGLGLSICSRIVAAHGGRIWIDENPGGGTVVRFLLPRSGGAA